MTKPENLFSAEDQKRLKEAVRVAEQATAGEIVPYVVGRSDSYPEAPWRAGTLMSFLVLAVLTGFWVTTDLWLPYGVAETAVLTVLGFLVGAGLALLVPRLKLIFIAPSVIAQRVDERAGLAFLSEEVFATRDRTGILIFLSLLEHRVRILGDQGINAKVEQKEWDDMVTGIVAGMKRGAPADALLHAVRECGGLLNKAGVDIRPDDTNELDNSLRLKDK